MSFLRAFGGGELHGDKLVRFVYLDESGTGGSPKKQPHVVVAGVLVNADAQLKGVEHYLTEMADAFCLAEDRPGFVFHASQLAGADPKFRDRYPEAKRITFLERLCEIPSRFSLPVAAGSMDRLSLQQSRASASADELLAESIALAALDAAFGVETYMREHFPDEVATLVFEQNGKKDRVVRSAVNMLRSQAAKVLEQSSPDQAVKSFEKIAETAFFAEKGDSSLLQVADAVTHVLCRKRRDAKYSQQCFDGFRKQLIRFPEAWRAEIEA